MPPLEKEEIEIEEVVEENRDPEILSESDGLSDLPSSTIGDDSLAKQVSDNCFLAETLLDETEPLLPEEDLVQKEKEEFCPNVDHQRLFRKKNWAKPTTGKTLGGKASARLLSMVQEKIHSLDLTQMSAKMKTKVWLDGLQERDEPEGIVEMCTTPYDPHNMCVPEVHTFAVRHTCPVDGNNTHEEITVRVPPVETFPGQYEELFRITTPSDQKRQEYGKSNLAPDAEVETAIKCYHDMDLRKIFESHKIAFGPLPEIGSVEIKSSFDQKHVGVIITQIRNHFPYL